MSHSENSRLIAVGQVVHEYYLAMQAVKKADARYEKAMDALRATHELNDQRFSRAYLYKHREKFAHLKQLQDELKVAQFNERRCRAQFIKAAKEYS